MKQIYALTIGILATIALAGAVLLFSRLWPAQNQARPDAVEWGFMDSAYSSPWSRKIPDPSPPLGVMIENELMSRPFQQGLSKAQVVYEAPTEGGITRFLAIFMPGEYMGKMGPIRSARSYFLDWLEEYRGMYVHVGGRSDALARLRKKDVFDADQYFNENYFWRENVGKTALEHTMFSTGEKLRELAMTKNWTWNAPEHFQRKGGNGEVAGWKNAAEAKNISIDFGFPSYRVDYSYDEASGVYWRSQAGKPHVNNVDNVQISARAIIVQTVRAWSNGDEKFSISIKTAGEGPAEIFYKGKRITGRWRKEMDASFPTKYFDKKDGREIDIPEGPVWIEIVPDYNKFTVE